MAVFFTADSHFHHPNVINFAHRPFRDIDEMHEQLIARWNAVVGKGDVVYHLGDFSMLRGNKPMPAIERALSALNGTKILVAGNHDRKCVLLSKYWAKVTEYHSITEQGQPIMMSHYPMQEWNRKHYGSWMLHGHSHGNCPGSINGEKDVPTATQRRVDVGVDCWGYTPVSFDRLKSLLDGVPFGV